MSQTRRATMRRNGRHMITVTVRHHLALDDAAIMLADYWNGTVPELRNKGRVWAAKQLRGYIVYRGDDRLLYAHEAYPDDEFGAAFDAARRFLVDIGMFPYEP